MLLTKTLCLCAAVATLAGCTTMVAGALSVGTPEEIKRSSYTAGFDTKQPIAVATDCMKKALAAVQFSHQSKFTYRDIGPEPFQLMLDTNAPSTYSGMRSEILILVENTSGAGGGTRTSVWAHPRMLGGGGSQAYLDKAMAALRPCRSDT